MFAEAALAGNLPVASADRGPNVDGPHWTKVEPLPAFDPAIRRVRLVGSNAVVER